MTPENLLGLGSLITTSTQILISTFLTFNYMILLMHPVVKCTQYLPSINFMISKKLGHQIKLCNITMIDVCIKQNSRKTKTYTEYRALYNMR